MKSTESEDRAIYSGAKDCITPQQTSIFALFSSWLKRCLLSRTSELELRLVDRDKEIDYLKSQVAMWQNQYLAFQDSILLSKGMKGTSPSTKSPEPPRIVSSNIPGENLQMEVDLDNLKERIIYHPEEAADVIGDLLATGKPRDKELAKRLVEWSEKIPDGNNGVVIATN